MSAAIATPAAIMRIGFLPDEAPPQAPRTQLLAPDRSLIKGPADAVAAHHATGRPSRKKPPVGPSSGSVAAQTTLAAPSCTSRPPPPPMSVLTHPGQTLLTRTPVPASSPASNRVRALSAAFEAL